MTDRDRRYNASAKGRRRSKRFEVSPARRAYQRAWIKAYRKRLKKKEEPK